MQSQLTQMQPTHTLYEVFVNNTHYAYTYTFEHALTIRNALLNAGNNAHQTNIRRKRFYAPFIHIDTNHPIYN